MKKRMLSFALSLVLALSLFPAQMVFAGNAAQPINTTYNTMEGAESSGSLFHNAYVRNANITAAHPNGTAQNLDVVLNLKGIAGTSQIFAVVMSAADYKTLVADKGGPTKVEGGLGNSTYHSLKVSDASRYAMGRADATDTADNQKWVIRLITPDSKNDFDTTVGKTVMGYKTMPKAGVGSSGGSHYYYDEYVLIVFGQGQFQTNEQYYISRFYLDSDGYVRTPSYMLKYDTNDPVGTSVPNWNGRTQIQRAAWSDSDLAGTDPGTVTLKAANENPTCIGYKFIGWTTDKRNPLAEGAPEPTDPNFYKAGAVFPKQTDYTVTTIYALWQTVPVKFSHTDGTKYTVVNEGTEEAPNWVMEWKTAPQVGVTLNSDPIAYAQPANSSSQPYGNKTFVVKTYQGSTELSTANPYNNISVGRLGAAGAQYQWGFIATGGPNNHTYKEDGTAEDYRMVITVTDPSNNTSDTITVRFPKIEKRAQNAPDPDVNTGLEGAVDTLTGTDNQKLPQAVEDAKLAELNADGGSHTAADLYDFKDGKLTGFYSVGQKLYQDVGGNKMNDGTGSLRDYYLKNGMIYEYRPYKEGAGADEGWREVPYPGNYYSGANKTTVEAAMGYRTDKTAYTKAKVVTNVNQAGITSVTAGTRTDPWPEEYGWIVWENNLPVVHGLTEGAVYEVRFRSNTTSSASTPVQVAVVAGGAVVGGGSSSGLLFNLMRGSVWKLPKAVEEPVEAPVETIQASAGANGSMVISNVKEAEATAVEGEDPQPPEEEGKSVIINAGETKTLTVLDPETACTVTVTPEEGFTPEVKVDGAAAVLTDNALTLPMKNTTGTLKLEVSFTTVELPPEPEAQSDGPADVTDTLFAPSTAGKLPDGTGVTLAEGETLELRDPDGAPVDEITFYVSATGSVLSPGAIDLYVCKLNGAKTGLVWTKNDEPVTDVQINGTFLSLAAQFGGKANPSDFVTVVCYDWDETLLGSVTVPKGESADVVEGYMNDFVRNLQSHESKDVDSSKASYWIDSKDEKTGVVQYPLTYKRGYSFLCWLPNDSTLPTHCGRALSTANGEMILPTPSEEEQQSFAGLQNNIVVKACYKDNSELYYDISGGVANMQYTIEQICDRVGETDTYSITVTVKREHVIDGVVYGVPRLVEPQLRATYTVGRTSLFNFFEISTSDVATFTIYPANVVTTVGNTVVDFYGAAVKTAAAAKSNGLTVDAAGAGTGFISLGTTGTINRYIAANDLSSISAGLVRDDAQLTYSGRIANVRTSLRTAWEKKNSIDGDGQVLKDEKDWIGLTWNEMQIAIDTGGNWNSSPQN